MNNFNLRLNNLKEGERMKIYKLIWGKDLDSFPVKNVDIVIGSDVM
jgi:hypothetical protein